MKLADLFEQDAGFNSAELEEVKDAIATIKRDCKPFLDQLGGNLMYRGSRSQNHGPTRLFSKRGVRTNRRPTNTDPHVHDQMNDWFEKKFKIKARSETVFTTGRFADAKGYGTVYCIFPIGDFKFIWSPKIDDLFVRLRAEHEADIPGFLDAADYQDDDLAQALRGDREIMVACKEYYLLLANTPEQRMQVLRMLE